MAIPGTITTDLQKLSDDIDAQNKAVADKATADATLVTAQQAASAAASAVTTAQATTSTDQQTLLNDIAAWVGGGAVMADVHNALSSFKTHLARIK